MESSKRAAFARFVESDDYPCVGAKAALAHGTIEFFEAGEIDRATDDLPFYKALCGFAEALDPEASFTQSFVAIFSGPSGLTEPEFEAALWDRLQALHNIDAAAGRTWARDGQADPSSPHFSMSVCGAGFFIVGLHPGASRSARRFAFPALVFNSHEQFERLRRDGIYDRMKEVIRDRDEALDGSVNPMLDDFGTASEARQYSGRPVRENWKCPLSVQEPLGED